MVRALALASRSLRAASRLRAAAKLQVGHYLLIELAAPSLLAAVVHCCL